MTDPQKPEKGGTGFYVTLILFVILAIVVLLIASVVIHDASKFSGWFGKYMTDLFKNAGLNPNNPDKFGNFVELILIAGFFGWAWGRFKRK